MKKITLGMILVIVAMQDVHGFHLTSREGGYQLISQEVANSIPLFKGGSAFNIPGATKTNLKHLKEYLIRQHQTNENAKKDPLLSKSSLDNDPQEEWKKYSTEVMNEPQLIALTKTVVSIFSGCKSLPGGIVESWNSVIQRGNYDAESILGFFNEPGEQIEDSLGQKIYDACAKQRHLPTVDELRKSSVGPGQWINTIKSSVSQRWAQMDRLEKWVVGGGIPIFVLFCLYMYKK